MNIFKKLASDTAIYGISSIIGRILNYLLVPFYTSIFLPAEYGIITEFYAYAAFFNILYVYGMETTYFRFASQNPTKEVFILLTSLLTISSFLFSVLLVCLATPIINLLGYADKEIYIYYFAAILLIDTILVIPFADLRFTNQAKKFAGYKCFQIALNILLNFILLYNTTPIIEYVFLANLVSNLFVIPLLGKKLVDIRFTFQWHKLYPMVIYALPLLIIGLTGVTNEMLSRLLLKYLLTTDFYPQQSKEATLGIFGACYKLSIFMSLAIQAFRYAAEPFFFNYARDQKSPQLFSKIMHGYVVVTCFIWFAISTNLDILGAIFLRNPAYHTALEIVPYLCLAYAWLGIYYNLSVWFKLTDRTYYGSWIVMAGSVITIALNIFLVPYYGYWGSVWATLASSVSMTIICYYKGQKYYPIPYKVLSGLLYILLTLILIIIVRDIQYANLVYATFSNISFTLAFGLFLFFTNKNMFIKHRIRNI